ncbi:hypothetical protein BU15DRAFT_84235 [Melanogaster broomeanus]|nr:hypothetical protein BU15DRAFT_84235 [Melanogaster broomeanus]
MLCQHIAAKEPLALALAECVKVCRVTNCRLGLGGSSNLEMLSQIYLAGMARMKNIRELEISHSNVTTDYWDVISTLELLQKLCYHSCDFLESPVGIDPDRKVKVPYLEAMRCNRPYHMYAAVDARHLRTLVIDMMDVDFGYETDWLSLSGTAVTELRIYSHHIPAIWHIRRLQEILRHTAHSLQALTLLIYPFSDVTQVLFEDPAWRNMPHLRSLTLQVRCREMSPMAVIRWVCDGVRVHGGLQSFSVQDAKSDSSRTLLLLGPRRPIALSGAEIRQIVHEELDCIPGLNFVEISGTSVRLVDGKWIDAEGYAS